MTLSAALPFLECPPLHPLPPGVIGDVAEMGDAKPTDWRRGPVDEVAAGEESDVSMGGGDAGCWLIVKGEGNGMPKGDIGKAIFAGDFIAEAR